MDDMTPVPGETLDPVDWSMLRAQGHAMLDDMIDHLEHRRAEPVWRPIPGEVRAEFGADLPTKPADLGDIYGDFRRLIMPYATGNTHPGFMGWVHGGGTAIGMLAEMLAAGLNANLGGRDHMPIEAERQVVRWVSQIVGFPVASSGLFVTGTSLANYLAVVVARRAALGPSVRSAGIAASGLRLTAYASASAHACVAQAMDLAGLGTDALRLVPVDAHYRMDTAALARTIAEDRRVGFTPFLVIGTAGTVDTGAIDDLTALADLAAAEKLWFHIDGAFGALAILSPELAPRLVGIERAHSLACDFHKWGQVPYDAGFILVRDGTLHRDTFASPAAYLRRETRGLAAGSSWPCDFGPDLSRSFRALKVWFTLRAYGTERLGAMIARSCALARYLERRVLAEPRLELMAPVSLNIVCFRYRAADADRVNAAIVADLHEAGVVAPSTTVLGGALAIRAAIVNHRTQPCDIDALVAGTLECGERNEKRGAA